MSNVPKTHFQTFAQYNRWANERLFEACSQLSDAEYLKERPAFFKSLHGALNHSLVADRMAVGWITGHDSGLTALDQQLYGDLVGLRVARTAEDAQIIALIDGISEDDLAAPFLYYSLEREPYEQPMHLFLANFFNHQTHHRGQAHDLLSQTAIAPPPLDLFYYLLEIGVR